MKISNWCQSPQHSLVRCSAASPWSMPRCHHLCCSPLGHHNPPRLNILLKKDLFSTTARLQTLFKPTAMSSDKYSFQAHHNLQEYQKILCLQSPCPEVRPVSESCSCLSRCEPSLACGCLRGSAETWSWGGGPQWSACFALPPPGTSAVSPTRALMLPLGVRRGGEIC